jgi:hypothetical protein
VAIIIAKIGQLILKNKEKLDKVKKLPQRRRSTPKPTESSKRIADKISKGHAYDKHVKNRSKDFPEIKNRRQFKKHIEEVMNNPSKVKKLERGRTGYLDKDSGTIVVHNPKSPDGGTAFRPGNPERYFENTLK